MRYVVHTTRDFSGTHFIEIGPGKYSGKHWQRGFVFVDEEDFHVAEGLIRKHLPHYDHFEMNNISKDRGLAIINEWRAAVTALADLEIAVFEILSLHYSSDGHKKSLEEERSQISELLNELAEACEGFIRGKSGFCILGV